MTNCLIIAAKEFRSYFRTPIAYVFMIVFLVVMGWFFFWVGSPTPFFKRGVVEMRSFFTMLPWVFLFLIPAVSMRMWSEEKKVGTLELLLTMPLRESEVVVGKFLAGFGLLFVTFIFTLPIPIILNHVGNPDFGPIWGGYLGGLFLGGAFLAVGLFASGLTENQIVAYIIGLVICAILLFVGMLPLQGILPVAFERIVQYLSLVYHFESIQRGVLDTRDVVYYLTVITFFLFLNARTVKVLR
jgi:ABC-2 type transport system permease protein